MSQLQRKFLPLSAMVMLTGHIQFCNCFSLQVWVNLTRTPLHINSLLRLRKRHTLSFKPSHFYTCHELFFCRRKQKLAVESNIWIIHASEHTLAEELGTELGESWRHRSCVHDPVGESWSQSLQVSRSLCYRIFFSFLVFNYIHWKYVPRHGRVFIFLSWMWSSERRECGSVGKF